MRKEILFLGAAFLEFDVPFDKNFLFRYFRSPLEKQFLLYYLCFEELDYFVEHTGYYCQKRWLLILKRRLEKILKLHNEFKSNFEIEKLKDLENGKLKDLT